MGKVLTTKTIRTTHGIPSEHQRQFFRLVDSEPLLIIERLRLVDGIPICVETNWFSCAFDSLTEKGLKRLSLYGFEKMNIMFIPFDGNKTIELCYASPRRSCPSGCSPGLCPPCWWRIWCMTPKEILCTFPSRW